MRHVSLKFCTGCRSSGSWGSTAVCGPCHRHPLWRLLLTRGLLLSRLLRPGYQLRLCLGRTICSPARLRCLPGLLTVVAAVLVRSTLHLSWKLLGTCHTLCASCPGAGPMVCPPCCDLIRLHTRWLLLRSLGSVLLLLLLLLQSILHPNLLL